MWKRNPHCALENGPTMKKKPKKKKSAFQRKTRDSRLQTPDAHLTVDTHHTLWFKHECCWIAPEFHYLWRKTIQHLCCSRWESDGGKKKNRISAEAAKVLNQPDALETPELSTSSEDGVLSQAPFTAPVILFFNLLYQLLFVEVTFCQSPADLLSSFLFNCVGSCVVRFINERTWTHHSSSSYSSKFIGSLMFTHM